MSPSKTTCDSYRGIQLAAHAGKILLKFIVHRLDDYSKIVGILPEKKDGFRVNRSFTNIMFVIDQLQAYSCRRTHGSETFGDSTRPLRVQKNIFSPIHLFYDSIDHA